MGSALGVFRFFPSSPAALPSSSTRPLCRYPHLTDHLTDEQELGVGEEGAACSRTGGESACDHEGPVPQPGVLLPLGAYSGFHSTR